MDGHSREAAPRRRGPTPVGDLIPGALRDLGAPSARVTRRIHETWTRIADPTWASDVRPVRLQGGILFVGVRSSSLRQELAQFHQLRLLEVVRAALPDVPLVAIRFVADAQDQKAPGPSIGG